MFIKSSQDRVLAKEERADDRGRGAPDGGGLAGPELALGGQVEAEPGRPGVDGERGQDVAAGRQRPKAPTGEARGQESAFITRGLDKESARGQ